MKLTPELINAKNPATTNDVCNAIRDFFLANATCKPICMACDLEPVEHSSEPALTGLIVFRVSKNTQEVVDEYASILECLNPTDPDTTHARHWQFMNDMHRELTTVEPCVEYTKWKPTLTVSFRITLTASDFPAIASTTTRNEWGWHRQNMDKYDQEHMKEMLKLWVQVKPLPIPA